MTISLSLNKMDLLTNCSEEKTPICQKNKPGFVEVTRFLRFFIPILFTKINAIVEAPQKSAQINIGIVAIVFKIGIASKS